MARRRGPNKFSFPLPRRSRAKFDDDDHAASDHGPSPSTTLVRDREWSRDDSSTSKAHRVLGTTAPIRQSVSHHASVPASTGYIDITVSEASYGSHVDDKTSATPTHTGRYSPHAAMPRRPSSNILGRVYTRDGRNSDSSSASHQLQPQTSNSTMRSHYDAKNSPMAISQQTSDSAVRDRALRRGHPQVVADYGYNSHVASPMSPVINKEDGKKESRKSKPARLDLSKLFPKPKGGDGQNHANALLSPNKMVNSPAAMSITSDYFPRPMTREPTPQIGGQAKLKTTTRHQQPLPQQPPSPARLFKRDEFDNAKVHVRRPPKGVQHWFDALDEDSDEASEDDRQPIYAPKAIRPQAMPKIPIRKTSLTRLAPDNAKPRQIPQSHYLSAPSRNDTFSHEDIVDVSRLTSPSQFSEHSLGSINTKESVLSKSNLHDASVLSCSSSEDEYERAQLRPRKFDVRKSLELQEDADEVIIGQARAFEVRSNRRPSEGKISMRSISTNAATIEVMYTPEPPFPPPYHFPRNTNLSGSWRSSHTRQPSVIPEDEDVRPVTAANFPISPSSLSIRSARTSASEPKPHTGGASHKLMAVTAEEEALLEMMRKKRAAMAKKGLSQGDPAQADEDNIQKTPKETAQKKYRTSGFLSMEASPVRSVEPKRTRRAVPPSPLLLTARGRPLKTAHDAKPSINELCDSSTSSYESDRHHSPVTRVIIPHQLPTPSEFSPLDLFPPSSPTPTASITSPTTTDQPSSLPSPITPGLRGGESDVAVKVASSDTSADSEDVALLDTELINAPPSESIKSDESGHELTSSHQRRRTASSAADVTIPTPTLRSARDLASVTEAASRPASITDAPLHKLGRRNSRRTSGLSLATSNGHGNIRSGTSSLRSTPRNSTFSPTSGYYYGVEKRSSRGLSRGNSVASSRTGRNSVSEDVLAAWGSLGGTY